MEKTQLTLFLFATISLIAFSYAADAFAEDEITVEFLEDSYSHDGTAVIRVTDSKMDDSSIPNSVDVALSSDADTIGTTITLQETDNTSGIFEGTVFFVLDDYTSGHRLQVVQGGEIYATYGETTVSAKIEGTPSPITDTAELEETSIKSFYPSCAIDEKCSLHYYQFLKDSPMFKVVKGDGDVFHTSYVLENAVMQSIGYIEDPSTVIFNIEPTDDDDGHLLLGINNGLFYPRYQNDDGDLTYIVYVDGQKAEFFQHDVHTVEIPFDKNTSEIRLGGQFYDMDVTTASYGHLEFPYTFLPEDIPAGKRTLKLQLDYDVNPHYVKCLDPDHVLTERPNEKLACVFEDTALKMEWEIVDHVWYGHGGWYSDPK